MAGEEVKLLSLWASPYVMRVEVALVLKGVHYEKVEEDFSNKSELLLQSNPVYSKVPVLLHNGKAVCESSLIVQYVDEVWPSPDGGTNILPADAHGKAVARFWTDYVDQKLFDVLLVWIYAIKGSEEEKKAAEENVVAALYSLEGALGAAEGPFFGGGHMEMVDVMLAPLLVWLPAIEELAGFCLPWADKLPRLEAWSTAGRAHPVASVLPEPPKIIEIRNEVFSRFSWLYGQDWL